MVRYILPERFGKLVKGGGGWSRFRGDFFVMNVELLTFPCRDMIKLSTHI